LDSLIAVRIIICLASTESLIPSFQWIDLVIYSVQSSDLRPTVEEQIKNLKARIDILKTTFQVPVARLLPRPALILMGYVLSSIYLLEHALWSHENSQPEKEVDLDVFKRWMDDSGFIAAVEDLKKAKAGSEDAIRSNNVLVFGSKAKL
jgi:hypothetical protein